MSTETITELRGHLFSALRGLTDTKSPMDIDRARAVSDVAQTIINSAKVEIEHMKVAGGDGSGFIPSARPATPAPHGTIDQGPSISKVIEQRPGVTVRRHTLK